MKKKLNMLNKSPIYLGIIFLLTFIFVTLLLLGGAKEVRYFFEERYIDKKFHEEVSQIPQMKITFFNLWEGDSMVTAKIEGKGEVKFWYDVSGVPRIDSIGNHSTSYACFFVDENGKKVKYAFDQSLVLNKEGKFLKWFPFQVESLQELADKYDDIVAVVQTLPHDPQRVPFEDSSGSREVIKESKPNFTLKDHYKGKELWCDLYYR
jgi:hypothetical protein